ncbi:unknown protein [Microcystis aeruginosa NIES-843]|uniref:Uncharacterized protein n=1 Tax=Microcystis aeruginosa (strain NIES-843 / IAM M-2473) TaxID=449447 RepID=B0JFS4_MICAN|nr:unknown protein [Microcystis aeruginosa NIES-843]
MAGVHLPEPKSSNTRESRKRGTEKRNCFPAPGASSPCPVSETPELTRVVRQFLEANRAPWQGEKDF